MKGSKNIMYAIVAILALAMLATFASANTQHATQAPEPKGGCGGGSIEPEEPQPEPTPQTRYTTTYATHYSSSIGVNTKRAWVLDKVITDEQGTVLMKVYYYQTYKVRGCKYSDWPHCHTKNYYKIIKTEKINWIG